MRWTRWTAWIPLPLLRLLLGAIFLLAGTLKLQQPVQSILAIGAYDLLAPGPALATALLLPGLEIAVGAALLSGALVRGASALAAGLSLCFVLVVGSAWLRDLDVSCGCFGPWSGLEQAGAGALLVELLLLTASILVWRHSYRPRGARGWPAPD